MSAISRIAEAASAAGLATAAASARQAERALALRREGRPRPGDLLSLPQTAGLPMEWAVLARESKAGGRLHLVAADASPLAGASDLAMTAEPGGGPITLRCRFTVWLDEAAADPCWITGWLDPSALEAARAKLAQVAGGAPSPAPTLRELETEADSEYQDWVASVLTPAHAALAENQDDCPAKPSELAPYQIDRPAKSAEMPPSQSNRLLELAGSPERQIYSPTTRQVVPPGPPHERPRRLPTPTGSPPLQDTPPGRQLEPAGDPRPLLSRSTLALAGSLLLVTALGLGALALLEGQRLRALGARYSAARAEIQRLSLVGPGLPSSHRAQPPPAARPAGPQPVAPRPAAGNAREPGPRPAPAPIPNLPFVWLTANETLRGEPGVTTVHLPAGADLLLVILDLGTAPPFPEYRLEVRRQTGAATSAIWLGRGLYRTGAAEVTLALPRRLLPSGTYRLHLEGLRDRHFQPAGDFTLLIE